MPTALLPTYALEAGIYATLADGPYTAIVRGVGATEGVGIIEIFEVDERGNAQLVNSSTRSYIGTGDDVLIGGVIVTGNTPQKVTFRARGTSLSDFNVPGVIADPYLQLFDSTGTLIDTNDNWQDHSSAGAISVALQPTQAAEAAITRTPEPGAYKAIVRGSGNTTEVGILAKKSNQGTLAI
jgi:hypothetical protein